jgi:hypothetical protein
MQLEREGAALAEAALQAKLAAHALDETSADGQTQPGPAHAP